jgi:hypothetical protein
LELRKRLTKRKGKEQNQRANQEAKILKDIKDEPKKSCQRGEGRKRKAIKPKSRKQT